MELNNFILYSSILLGFILVIHLAFSDIIKDKFRYLRFRMYETDGYPVLTVLDHSGFSENDVIEVEENLKAKIIMIYKNNLVVRYDYVD